MKPRTRIYQICHCCEPLPKAAVAMRESDVKGQVVKAYHVAMATPKERDEKKYLSDRETCEGICAKEIWNLR